jgi:hypothetical protein
MLADGIEVIELHSEKFEGHWEAKCKCFCGKIFFVRSSFIQNKIKRIRSCGCKQYDRNISNAAIRVVLRTYINNAYKRNINWKLTDNEALILLQSNCFYCGCAPNTKIYKPTRSIRLKHTEFSYYNGIDRLQNNEGYTSINAVPCCEMCNKLKGNRSIEEFIMKTREIHNYLNLSISNNIVQIAMTTP